MNRNSNKSAVCAEITGQLPKDVRIFMGNISNTQYFKAVQEDKKMEVGEVLREVYEALTEKGYNPINQIVGYIMSGDPTYITSYKSARSLIMKVERDEILEELMENYIDTRLR